MAILKCKMCGGDLNVVEGQTVCECDYCGSKQTVPTLDNEKKLTLFTRANRLRSMCEFDKAYNVYESIVSEFPEEAEAYWGLVLCKYGIEYVDDPASGKKIPTCHRSSFDPVLEDGNFEMIMEYADSLARSVYRTEAKEIERLRSGILEVSAKEQPYDIFICYKETDENGGRTIDSVIAQDVYTALTEKGYRVFFSRITLEDKLGQEYEPYIFAALHSAKIMLVFGTDYDYFNAVWVKNEWSRYLALIAKGEKKTLIPCYKDIDAYDMPQEFKRLQAQDMGKIGAIQDLLRGIEKILPRHKTESVRDAVAVQLSTAAPLIKRAFIFLEEGEWIKANEYCEKALDADPENGDAYLGKLMAERGIHNIEEFAHKAVFDLEEIRYYQYAVRFASPEKRSMLEAISRQNHLNVERVRLLNGLQQVRGKQEKYERAEALINEKRASSAEQAVKLLDRILPFKDAEQRRIDYAAEAEELHLADIYANADYLEAKGDLYFLKKAADIFASIPYYKDAAQRKILCETKAVKAREEADKEAVYQKACSAMRVQTVDGYTRAAELFEDVRLYRDSDLMIETCKNKVKEIEAQEVYRKAEKLAEKSDAASLKQAAQLFAGISEYGDAKEQGKLCLSRVEEAERIERLQQAYNKTYPLLARKNELTKQKSELSSHIAANSKPGKGALLFGGVCLLLALIEILVGSFLEYYGGFLYVMGGIFGLIGIIVLIKSIQSRIKERNNQEEEKKQLQTVEEQLSEIESYPTFETWCKSQN